ncbi:MAG: MalY/PatB family protein [Anaerotardibacter sp.]
MFDFDKEIDRSGTNALKWEWAKPGELPMWVADMDFEVAPAIQEAIIRRAKQGVYGYTVVPQEFSRAVCLWWKKRHDLILEPEQVLFSAGVMPTVAAIIHEFTQKGEKIVLLAPNYNCFYSTIKENEREVYESNLVYEKGKFHIDFEDLEEKLSHPEVNLFIFCNPHNPTGNVWSAEDIAKIGTLCEKHGVLVASDEIHCEVMKPGVAHVPFARVNDVCADLCITAASPSKAFNVAGLQSSYAFTKNQELASRLAHRLHVDKVAEPNVFAADITIAAYEQSETWLDEVNDYIQKNKELAYGFVKANIPEISVIESDATYLLWLDCSKIVDDAKVLQRFIRKETGLFVTEGIFYGEAGKAFMRMNIATSRKNVEDGLARLKAGVEGFCAWQS